MARIHLFEFEDLNWFPKSLRNYGTDFLQFLSNKTKLWRPAVPILQNLISKTNSTKILDLASGGGGGLIWLNSELKRVNPELDILLSDFYPNVAAFEYTKKQADNFEHITIPIDARKVPENLNGLRTQFLSFHHFKPNDAIKILENAVSNNKTIAIFEAQERSVPSILAMLSSPISVLLVTPFIRPFKLGRIIFTYLIPIVPIFVLWDGIVSSLRTYSTKEMKELVKSVKNHNTYDWNIDKVKNGPGVMLYLTGSPK